MGKPRDFQLNYWTFNVAASFNLHSLILKACAMLNVDGFKLINFNFWHIIDLMRWFHFWDWKQNQKNGESTWIRHWFSKSLYTDFIGLLRPFIFRSCHTLAPRWTSSQWIHSICEVEKFTALTSLTTYAFGLSLTLKLEHLSESISKNIRGPKNVRALFSLSFLLNVSFSSLFALFVCSSCPFYFLVSVIYGKKKEVKVWLWLSGVGVESIQQYIYHLSDGEASQEHHTRCKMRHINSYTLCGCTLCAHLLSALWKCVVSVCITFVRLLHVFIFRIACPNCLHCCLILERCDNSITVHFFLIISAAAIFRVI